MKVEEALKLLPDRKGAIVILSGGMDSTIATILAVEKYGAENVHALTFFYGQKQAVEIERAKETCNMLGIKHKILDLSILGDISQGFSSNVDKSMKTPTIQEVLGDPSPSTEVPYRNMILLSIASAYAQVCNLPIIICGLQVHDLYSYWDTTTKFIGAMNEVINQNRMFQPHIIAPFSTLSKTDELEILMQIYGNVNALKSTLTCYDPDEEGRSCGVCPSCAERLKAFDNLGLKDPVEYV